MASSPVASSLERCCQAATGLGRRSHRRLLDQLGLVIVLTGLYTMLGGMRAVAYNDAVQVVILILGSASLTVYGLMKLGGWEELRRVCGSDMFNLMKPLIPAQDGRHLGPGQEPNRIA
ncbi:MAG: hypothetical protein U1G07_06250 [Verrucomicrobiota bacterium]